MKELMQVQVAMKEMTNSMSWIRGLGNYVNQNIKDINQVIFISSNLNNSVDGIAGIFIV